MVALKKSNKRYFPFYAKRLGTGSLEEPKSRKPSLLPKTGCWELSVVVEFG